ncbi:MAG: hypothetical protein JNN20_13665 [Betaproteobacteria bacterium]|nr:hypothetical protein [Betaproteobacteria bacterium]
MLAALTGCAFLQQPAKEIKAIEVTVPAKPSALTEEAEAALKVAEQSVLEARAKRALWIAAVEHLAKAREAAKVFDSAATLTHSKEVVALCALSLQQLSAPPVKW